MNLKIAYSKATMKFINKNPHLISEDVIDGLVILAVKKIYNVTDTNVDLKLLKGDWKGYYRIRKGKIRIIFSIKENENIVTFIKNVEFKGDIY